jgi:glutamate-5-semialdehyde dehydrogenase
MELQQQILKLAQQARKLSYRLSQVSLVERNSALKQMAEDLLTNQNYIIRENAKDLKAAKEKRLSQAMVDRLVLNEKRISAMADSLMDTVDLKDPIGELLETIKRPNGLIIKKVRVPLGVVGIIYESRPNVTSDCVGLCLKSGNVSILKGGKEAIYSNKAVFKILKQALKKTTIPPEVINLIESTDRAAVKYLLDMEEYVDVIVPRGGEELIRFVAQHSKIPVIKHYKGVCHVYVSEQADLNMAHAIVLNAKVQRPGVCNALETLLVNKDVAVRFLPVMAHELKNCGVELRGCPVTQKILKKDVKKATEKDWFTEYLDLILSVRVVENTEQAIGHINHYGSHHSDAIVTEDKQEADQFLKGVDSACVYVNASTRFTDGYEFGFGAEVGISTDKLHVRGPMALEGLTTYKYEILGEGQIRS